MSLAPLDDPSYTPAHPPVNGLIPEVVAKWGPKSQLRWFDRYRRSLMSAQDWSIFYCTSEHHRGHCCSACAFEYEQGTGVQMDGWCCCQDERPNKISGD